MTPATRTWAEIDLSAIRHNAGVVRRKIGRQPGILAVVKANAYGHGSVPVAHALADLVDLFGVASLEEAHAILPCGRDVCLLSPSLPAERREVVGSRCIATVSSAAEAAAFPGGRVNLKVDTGMGRIGCPENVACDEVRGILELGNVELHSISTHLPAADEDAVATRDQLSRFDGLVREFRKLAPGARIHVLNSAGILGFPEYAYDLVRPGLLLYGSASPADFQPELRPAMTWKARVLLVRELRAGRPISYGRTFVTPHPMRVASLAVGYADGYPRQLSGRGACVLVGGRRCPVLGRVTMDQILVDISEVADLEPGDEAVLIGRQQKQEILAGEVAELAGTIAWDILAGVGSRVPRVALPAA